jgi:hypothetical protein
MSWPVDDKHLGLLSKGTKRNAKLAPLPSTHGQTSHESQPSHDQAERQHETSTATADGIKLVKLGSNEARSSARTRLVGKPALAPKLLNEILVRGGTAAPFRKGGQIPMQAYDLGFGHPGDLPQPAMARWFDAKGFWEWRACTVLDYNEASGRYVITWSKVKVEDPGKPFQVVELVVRNNQHAYASRLSSFTHLRAQLVLHDRGILPVQRTVYKHLK